MWICSLHKEARISWTLTKVTILQRANGRNFRGAATVSPQRMGTRGGRIRAICMMAWPRGNFRWEDVLHWWPLMDIHHYWTFPCPWCHQALLHLVKMTMSSWHSALQINMSLHNISRITYLFSPKFFTSTKETCLDVSLTSSSTTNSTVCCCSLLYGWPGHFNGLC